MKSFCWNITQKCNCNCKYCFRNTEEIDLTVEKNIEILQNLIKSGIKKITWSGGEPTCYDGLIELLKISKKNAVYNKLVTNASKFTDKNSYDIVDYIDEIVFSIDSVDDVLNEQFGRGKGYFNHINDVIEKLKSSYPQCLLSVNTIVMKPNLELIDDIYAQIKKWNLAKWKLIQFTPLRGKAVKNKSSFEISIQEYEETLNKYKKMESTFEIVGHTSQQIKEEHIIITPSGNII